MVLKHHPDKKGILSPKEREQADSYFTAIQKGECFRKFVCWRET